MTIEATLERIASALERLATASDSTAPAEPKTRTKKAAPAVVEPPKEEEAFGEDTEAEPVFTLGDVRAALKGAMARASMDKAKAALKSVTGTDDLKLVTDQSKFAAIIKAANAV